MSMPSASETSILLIVLYSAGGALALLAAEHGTVDGAVSFYGTPDPKLSHVCPPHPFKSQSGNLISRFSDVI